MLAAGDSQPGLMGVWARSKAKVCFRVTGDSGWLTLEIPSVHGALGNDYSAQVDMPVGTEEQSYDIDKNSWTPVGESADEQGRKFMLVELRTLMKLAVGTTGEAVGSATAGGTSTAVTTYQPGTGGLPAAGTRFGASAR
ncbi:hypothetical protein ABZ847_07800 [Streptomyces bauhiniae]